MGRAIQQLNRRSVRSISFGGGSCSRGDAQPARRVVLALPHCRAYYGDSAPRPRGRTKRLSSKEPSADDRFCEKEYADRARSLVAEEPKLREVVEAILDLNELQPSGIADVLNISAKEVYVRKKKLKRRLIELRESEVPREEQ